MATVVANTNTFWGMVIYEIRGDGTLHGEWKNNRHSNDSILSEIARKDDDTTTIEGRYTISWIEEDRQAHNGTLQIVRIQNDTALSFIWREGDAEVFRGMGMPIGLNRIAVTYWDERTDLNLNF